MQKNKQSLSDNIVLQGISKLCWVLYWLQSSCVRLSVRHTLVLSQNDASWDHGNHRRIAQGPQLLLMTNRKSHTPFRLVPKSTTLDDLEQPICTLSQKKMRLSEPTTKIWMKINSYYQRQKCRPIGQGLFGGSLVWGRQTTGLSRRNFQRFCWLFFLIL